MFQISEILLIYDYLLATIMNERTTVQVESWATVNVPEIESTGQRDFSPESESNEQCVLARYMIRDFGPEM